MSRHALGTATVRIGTILTIPALLRSLGADPAEVFAEARIDPALLDDPDNLISYEARGRLFSCCVARTGCQHFGLLVGERSDLRSLGLVGLLARHSPDVGSALRSIVRYGHLFVRGAVPSLTVDGDTAIFGYDIHRPNVMATDQIGDGALALMTNIMRTLSGSDWKPIEARFSHRKPEDVRPFRRFFRAPLRFDAEQNALVFDRAGLSLRLSGVDAEVQRLLQKEIDALDARHGDGFPGQVRSVLRAALITGHGSADKIAALFSMHSRTLSRRLTTFGTSFQALLDEGRFAIAQQMLQDTALDVAQIATVLNYADASAFTRAFRRWSGTTPAAWRATHRPSA